jgi:putative restriction endonuclease
VLVRHRRCAPKPASAAGGTSSPAPSPAACPAHDVAFDTGLLTVNGGLRIHLASRLTDAVQDDPPARQYYGRPPLQETLLLPPGTQAPARNYLDWHRNYVFAA